MALVLAGITSADTTFIEITSLPWIITTHSGATWDVYRINDDSVALHCDSFGIVFNDSGSSQASCNDYVMIDLSGDDGIAGNEDDDSIVFGMDKTYEASYVHPGNEYVAWGSFGIMTGAGTADSFRVRGGNIISAPAGITCSTEYSVEGAVARNHFGICAALGWNDDMIFDSVNILVRGCGYSLSGVNGTHTMYFKGQGLRLNRCRLINRTYAMGYRGSFYSTALTYTSSGGNSEYPDGNTQFHVRLESCYVDYTGHTGLNLYGAAGNGASNAPSFFQVEGCTLIVDNHNSDPSNGYTNGYIIHYRGAFSDGTYESYVRNNVFLAGNNFGGGRGMELRQCNEYMDGTHEEDTIHISGNYFDLHAGCDMSDMDYNTFAAIPVKWRRGNHYTNFHDNIVKLTLDSADSQPESNYHPVGVCLNVQLEMNTGDPIRKPYHLTIENNYCSVFVRNDSALLPNHIVYGAAMNISGMPSLWKGSLDTTIKIRNNVFYSQAGQATLHGSYWDASCQDVIIGPGNILSIDTDSGFNKGTICLGGSDANTGIIYYNNTYAKNASDLDVSHWSRCPAGYGDVTTICTPEDPWWDITFKRQCSLFVKGNNELPVTNAYCTLWDAESNIAVAGLTDSNGVVVCTTSYWYYENDAGSKDTTNWNNFTFHAQKTTDQASGTHTVSWTAAGGTDTLTLVNTAGDGEWPSEPAEEDNYKSIKMRGLKVRGGKYSEKVNMPVYYVAMCK